MRILVCDECCAGIANDDWTHLDYHYDREDADETYHMIQATLESLGWLTFVGAANVDGYFDCYICDEISAGGGCYYETE